MNDFFCYLGLFLLISLLFDVWSSCEARYLFSEPLCWTFWLSLFQFLLVFSIVLFCIFSLRHVEGDKVVLFER